MVIPHEVPHALFYREAKKKGVVIHSRYPNVYPFEGQSRTGLFWVSSIGNIKGQPHYLRKMFPFTEEGEIQAARTAVLWREQHHVNKRKTKRAYENVAFL